MSRPEKLFFKKGEVCQLANIQAHELRTWETEFSIRSVKSAAGHSLYRRKDIDLLIKIKALIYGEGLTVSGARKKLDLLTPVPSDPTPARDPAYELLHEIQGDLRELLDLMERDDPLVPDSA